MIWHALIVAQVWVGLFFLCQTIPWVQFGYNLDTPNHTLSTVWCRGMGLPVTPDILVQNLMFPREKGSYYAQLMSVSFTNAKNNFEKSP